MYCICGSSVKWNHWSSFVKQTKRLVMSLLLCMTARHVQKSNNASKPDNVLAFIVLLGRICISICMFSGELYSTLAVFCNNCIAVETRGTPLTFGPSCVTPAVLTVARYIVTLIDNEVGVWVAVAVTSPTGATDCHWVAVVTWGTPN